MTVTNSSTWGHWLQTTSPHPRLDITLVGAVTSAVHVTIYGRIAPNLYHRFAKKFVFHIDARIGLVVQFIYYIYLANKNDLCPQHFSSGYQVEAWHKK